MFSQPLALIFGAILLFSGIPDQIPIEQSQLPEEPYAVYLTWQKKPESTMTIHWISSDKHSKNLVSYRKKDSATSWMQTTGSSVPLPEGHSEYLVHTVELELLQSDSAYEFKINEDDPLLYFRTMPNELNNELNKDISFVVGGDIYHDSDEAVRETSRQAAKTNPRFALLGGDIAYATPKEKNLPDDYRRWLQFFRSWYEVMITEEGFLIPILPTTSNEDTKGRYGQTPAEAAFFLTFFSFPGVPGYDVMDFGDYMSLYLLDSGHINSIDGKQTTWLEKTLNSRLEIPHQFAAYHCPSYPGYRDLSIGMAPMIRKHWHPLFEKSNLSTAFEHHDHTYKRTHRIRNHQVDESGVLYMGDGGWGESNPRVPASPQERWYLAHSASERHFISVKISQDSREYRAINHKGIAFDSLQEKVQVRETVALH